MAGCKISPQNQTMSAVCGNEIAGGTGTYRWRVNFKRYRTDCILEECYVPDDIMHAIYSDLKGVLKQELGDGPEKWTHDDDAPWKWLYKDRLNGVYFHVDVDTETGELTAIESAVVMVNVELTEHAITDIYFELYN